MSENTIPARQGREVARTLEQVMIDGDLSGLTDEQRLQWYRQRCEAAGLDPRAQPFQYITLDKRLTLYATKAATDQLAANRGLSVEVINRGMSEGDIYEALCRVREPSGRCTENLGAVFVGGLTGAGLANARMKAITKGTRRAILAHCGLGMLDETETEHIPGTARVQVSEAGEVLDPRAPANWLPAAAPQAEPVLHDLGYWRRRAMALYTELGGEPGNQAACRADIAKDLGIDPQSRTLLTAEQWQAWAEHLDRLLREPAAPEAPEAEREAQEADPFGEAVIIPTAETGGCYAQQTVTVPAQMRGA